MASLIKLKELIVNAATAYYSGNPIISNEKFDSLIDQLRSIDPSDSILSTIGWGSQERSCGLVKVSHDLRFKRGFDKVKVDTAAEITEEYKTLKYDGASVTLYYDRDGNLYRAVTRNDGECGFDVTSKLKYLVPNHIDAPIHSITGEFILSKQSNESFYNSNSPRNLAVGKLMSKSFIPSEIVKFDFVAYRIMSLYNTQEGQKLKSEFSEHRSHINDLLLNLGFRSAPILSEEYKLCKYSDLFDILSELSTDTHTYLADGIVVDSGVIFDEYCEPELIILSYKNELAYKVITEVATVNVTDIVWNHTRTGRFVPTIIYDPVYISGAECHRATGHNAKYIKENNICIGSKIEIVRSGEVIPYISDVIDSFGECILPTHCECGSELMWDGVDLVCSNENCEYNNYNRLYNYIANVGAVKGVSSKLINAIINCTGWKSIIDIYTNPIWNVSNRSWVHKLRSIEGFGESSIKLVNETLKYLYDEIWYDCWIVGLGIKSLGKSNANSIKSKLLNYLETNDYGNWNFLDCSGIGNALNSNLNDHKIEILDIYNCVKDNLVIVHDRNKNNEDIVVDDLIKVCITGKMDFGTKSEFYSKYKDSIIESDINNCDLLICNKIGSSKYNRALKLGKKILSEQDAMKFLEK